MAGALRQAQYRHHNVVVLLCGMGGSPVKMLDIETSRENSPWILPALDGPAFGRLRQSLGLSQKRTAAHLGVSLKTVESYEQGWRPVPANIERLLYFLLFKLRPGALEGVPPCWKACACPPERRRECSAHLSREGHYCWFLTGKVCAPPWDEEGGAVACRACAFFLDLLARVEAEGHNGDDSS